MKYLDADIKDLKEIIRKLKKDNEIQRLNIQKKELLLQNMQLK